MKIYTLISSPAIAVLVGLLTSALHGQTVNLLSLDGVRTNGTYTYYARGNSYAANNANYTDITPFSYSFYPGPPHNNGAQAANANARDGALTDSVKLAGGTSTASSISVASGELTDSPSSTGTTGTGGYVGNWVGVTQTTGTSSTNNPGSFDVLFNLGSIYLVSSIEVVYLDTSGERITTTIGAQKIYTAATLADAGAPLESDFTLFGANTATLSTSTTGLISIAGTAVEAQYVDLRLMMNVSNPASSTDTSQGARLLEVRVNGSAIAIPEPSTCALIIGVGAFLICGMMRRGRCRY